MTTPGGPAGAAVYDLTLPMTRTTLEHALVGAVLDEKYRLDELLGQGGMGMVFKATHLGTDRVVAVKVIAPRHGDQPEFVERFRREARAAGRLRHPNVVDVTDFGFAPVGGRRLAYLVMEYLDGASLADVLEDEGRLPLDWVVEILDPVCSAVHEAHAQGIVHRDLKPDNLWLESDRRGGYTVKVLDFGLAKLAEPAGSQRAPAPPSGGAVPAPPPADLDPAAMAEGDTLVREDAVARSPDEAGPAGLTRVGQVLGTPLYMSPEQCRGDALDARSDVYSLGVIAYRMLAGKPPFDGDSATVIRRHLSEPPPPLRPAGRRLPRPVEELIASSLDKDPARRPPSAAAFAASLRARSERYLSFLRSVQGVLADRFGVLFRISLLAHLPLLLGSALLVLLGWALGPERQGLKVRTLASLTFAFGWMMGLAGNAAVSEPVIMQALVAPRRPVWLKALFQGLRGRIRAFIRTLLPFLVALTVPFAPLLLLPRRWATAALLVAAAGTLWLALRLDSFWFLSEAVIVEGLEGRAAHRRSRELARASRRHLPAMQRLGYLGFGLMAVLVSLVVLGANVVGGRLGPALAGAGALGRAGLAWAVATPVVALLMPLVTVPFALLYFRTREAGGEPLDQILSEFERRALPPSSWQMRLRDRLRTEIPRREGGKA
jgi:serine/threonine protein kinase